MMKKNLLVLSTLAISTVALVPALFMLACKNETESGNGSENVGGNGNGSGSGSDSSQQIINDAFELRKWDISNNQAISTISLIDDIDASAKAIIEYLYNAQNEEIKISNQNYGIQKAQKIVNDLNEYFLSFTFDTKNKSLDELNAATKIFFNQNWAKDWSALVTNLKNLSNSIELNIGDEIQLTYQLLPTSIKGVYEIIPYTLSITSNEKPKQIGLGDNIKEKYKYSLLLEVNLNYPNGTLINNKNSFLTLKNNGLFNVSDFSSLDEKNDSITSNGEKINKDFIVKNRSILFEDYDKVNDVNDILDISIITNFKNCSLDISINWKSYVIPSNFSIKFSEENLIKFSYLDNIYNWGVGSNYEIDGFYATSNEKIFDKLIQYLNEKISDKYGNNPQNFLLKQDSSNNKYLIKTQLNPLLSLSNEGLMNNFIRVYGQSGADWKRVVTILNVFPHADRISNISNIFEVEININSNIINISIIPQNVTIDFEQNIYPQIVWNYSQNQKDKKTYSITFENVGDDLKIKESLLSDLHNFSTKSGEAIAIDDRLKKIGNLTWYALEYLYRERINRWGYIPNWVWAQPLNNSDSNNVFYFKLEHPQSNDAIKKAIFSSVWGWNYDVWKQTLLATGFNLLDLNKIYDINIEFELEILNDSSSSNLIKCDVKPKKITIIYSDLQNQVTWNFSEKLKNKCSYQLIFKSFTNPIASGIIPGTVVKI